MCDCKGCKNYQSKDDDRVQKVQQAWNKYKELVAESDKIFNKAEELCNSISCYLVSIRKLFSQSDKLRAEAEISFADAILEIYGDVSFEYVANNGVVVCGKEYK